MRRFRVTGWKRGIFEVLGDAVTLGAGGSVILLALALPAFEATKTDWRSQSDYSVTFLDRYGNEIGKRGIRHSDSVPLDEMPDHLIKAVIATEDRRFFDHFGIDVLGTFRALVQNLRANAVVQGGSSLSQQLAKNLFLSNERTLERKIKEAFLAIWLEANLSKQEILKLYLDRAYMGGGNFGIEAASEFYFGKSVKDVNLAEAAMLAGLFKAPARYAPHINLPAARERANQVLTNLVQGGFMTEGQVIGARRHPADVVPQAAASASPDFFLDWAFAKVKEFNPKDHIITVRTTVDMGIEASVEGAIEEMLRLHGQQYRVTQSAAVVMDTDGYVRAMVGGRDYGESQFNRAADSLRQPGSSFKPFVYATALENGFTPDSIVVDAPICIGNWCPHNFSPGYRGRIPMTTALINSLNTVAVRLAQAVGRDKIVALAKAVGIETELKITRSLPLGTSEVSMIEMAGAYGAFASGGYKVTPQAFTQIISSTGEILYDARRDAKPKVRVLPEKVVAGMNFMMSQVPERGTGRAAKLDGIKTAGKTGTSSSFRDAWFDGFTGNYVGIVWYGNDNFTPMRRMTGGALPAMTWKRFMTYAHTGIELKPIPYVEPEKPAQVVADAKNTKPEDPDQAAALATAQAAGPSNLSVATTQWLNSLQSLMENAAPLKPVADLQPTAPVTMVAGEAAPAAPAIADPR
ncbi:MAG: penicillin-binding protein 1A [Rhizobiales bacterium]|nr:penicillin-binding protein 1A [Hyphomicrobiales bacterium]